jgi:hypothetical protein
MPWRGILYLTVNHLAFYANFFGTEAKVLVRFESATSRPNAH